MPVPPLVGTATLDSNVLVDALVPGVIDGLRAALHPAFGIRAYRVYRVIRTWSGAEPGDGTFVDVAGELLPQPRVTFPEGYAYSYRQEPAGLETVGRVAITELSLSYSEADLTGQPLQPNQELFIAIADAHGQGSTTALFTHAHPPIVDREKNMGWVLNLERVQAAQPWVPS